MAHQLVEGWTERIRDVLLSDGVAQNLTGFAVQLTAASRTGVQLTLGGTSGIDTASSGIVYFDPAAGDLLAINSPMFVRWKVTDGGGRVAFYPNQLPDSWVIRKP